MTDARKLFITRGIRGLVDGLVSVALVSYLTGLGFSPFQVGAIVTGTLLGSAAVTLGVGLLGYLFAAINRNGLIRRVRRGSIEDPGRR